MIFIKQDSWRYYETFAGYIKALLLLPDKPNDPYTVIGNEFFSQQDVQRINGIGITRKV